MSGEEFANFVRQNEAGFYRIAYSYVRSREDALDIVQDAVERACESCLRSGTRRV